MAINQLTTANTFEQWLISTQQLIATANLLTDGGGNTFVANTILEIDGSAAQLNVRTSADINDLYANTATFNVATANTLNVANSVTVGEDLSVTGNSVVNVITANSVTISENLEVTGNALFDSLNVVNSFVENLFVDVTTANSLNVVNSSIENLDVDVITANTINVVNSSIENLDVDVITANTINVVNSVTIGEDLSVTGNIVAENVEAKNFDSVNADVAEIYSSDQNYDPGTVVVFRGVEEITQSTEYADTTVAGIVSTSPAFIMNSEALGLAVALHGRVPCKVVGKIKKGDLIVTSSVPGTATKLNTGDWQPGCVIGKALENYDSDQEGIIEVVVGRV
jgi:hypothetical protein